MTHFKLKETGMTLKTEKWVESEIQLGVPFMDNDLLYQFQMICCRGIEIIELKPNRWTDA